jgi:3-deoxy-D-manno-octulosonate 8-phosphate phosphatase (KDO 8-P phosphatase)
MSEPSVNFTPVRAFLFDVDGVLSTDYSPLDESGEPVRTSNVKDGFALRTALASGYAVGVITGAHQERVKLRCSHLGINLYYENVADKSASLDLFIAETGIPAENILYMGDDIPDLPVMLRVGIPTSPADAIPEIKSISAYISGKKGGRGCVRDVVEKVMRTQGKWFLFNEKSEI